VVHRDALGDRILFRAEVDDRGNTIFHPDATPLVLGAASATYRFSGRTGKWNARFRDRSAV